MITDHFIDKLQQIDQHRLSDGWQVYGKTTKDWSAKIFLWLTTLWTNYKRLIIQDDLMVDHLMDKLQKIDQHRLSDGWPLHG